MKCRVYPIFKRIQVLSTKTQVGNIDYKLSKFKRISNKFESQFLMSGNHRVGLDSYNAEKLVLFDVQGGRGFLHFGTLWVVSPLVLS